MWVANQIRQLGHYENVSNPTKHTHAEYMEEDINMDDTGQGDPPAPETKTPLDGSGAPPTRATVAGAAASCASAQGGTLPTGATRLRFGTPEPPTLPIREGGGTNTGNISVEHQNSCATLRQ